MTHAQPDMVREIVKNLRELSIQHDRRVSIMMDFQGPAIRTGDLHTNLDLKVGDVLALTVRGEKSEEEYSVDVNYDELVDDISEGDVVMVDNGEIQLSVLKKKRNQLKCKVLTPGTMGSRRHINLPGVRVNLPALTAKDLVDLDLGIELGVDFFAMSFVREAADVMKLKNILDYRNAPQQIIAKLEDQEGIRNLDAIIAVADGIMVARGDLGIEVHYEELPIIQRRIVKHCVLAGKPVIVATHMLESMIDNPSPTRAEITDVANAVFEEADAIMLSGETSVGKYPIECLKIMDRIARRIEISGGAKYVEKAVLDDLYAKLIKSAVVLTSELNAAAMIVFTNSGVMARKASWLRPWKFPIYAFTSCDTLLYQLPLYRGLVAFKTEPYKDEELSEMVENAIQVLVKRGCVQSGETVVVVTEAHVRDKVIDTIQVETVV